MNLWPFKHLKYNNIESENLLFSSLFFGKIYDTHISVEISIMHISNYLCVFISIYIYIYILIYIAVNRGLLLHHKQEEVSSPIPQG